MWISWGAFILKILIHASDFCDIPLKLAKKDKDLTRFILYPKNLTAYYNNDSIGYTKPFLGFFPPKSNII